MPAVLRPSSRQSNTYRSSGRKGQTEKLVVLDVDLHIFIKVVSSFLQAGLRCSSRELTTGVVSCDASCRHSDHLYSERRILPPIQASVGDLVL